MREIKQGSVYTLADCGIFAALSVVLVLISAYIPFLGNFTMLIWAVPLVAVVFRRGVGAGIACGIVIAILSFFFTGPVIGILAGLSIMVYGITYGLCFKKGVSPGKTLFIGTIGAGVVTFTAFVLAMFLGSITLDTLFTNMERTFREVFAMYEQAGLLSNMIPDGYTTASYIDKMVDTFQRLLPGIFILISMAMAALNYMFSALILRKFHFEIRPLPPFREWHFPWWIMWGVAVVFLGYLMGKQFDNENYTAIALNILYIYIPIFLVAGISILSYFFHMWRMRKGVQIFVWVLSIFFLSFTLPFFFLMGAVDTLIDYRKLLQKMAPGKGKE